MGGTHGTCFKRWGLLEFNLENFKRRGAWEVKEWMRRILRGTCMKQSARVCRGLLKPGHTIF